MRLHDFLDYSAREHPEVEFAVHGERSLTYREALTTVDRLAQGLIVVDMPPGTRCAVLARNCIEYALLYFAASKAGVVLVPLNYRSAAPEWIHIVNDSRAALLMASSEFAGDIEAVRAGLPTVRRFITLDGVPVPDWDGLPQLMTAPPGARPDRQISDDDDVYQLYTSGTTGRPKGAVLSHRAVTANVLQIAMSPHRGAPGERALVIAPMCHAAVVWTTFGPVAWAGSLYILEAFDPAGLVDTLSGERIGFAVLVPTIIQTCLAAVPDIAERPYPALRFIHCGSAPLAEGTLRQAVAAFHCDFAHAYGMTEATAGITMMAPEDTRRALADRPDLILSAGRPFLGTELRIVNGDDVPVPPGTEGEIVVRGPQLMRGYWHLPAETDEALRGGWLHTGDVGFLDDDGYLHIRDRLKDVIVTGGVNVYPRMVEAVLAEHPAVAEVAVIAVPDDHWGEAVKAIVVRQPGASATAEDLVAFCRGKLGGFQRPRSVDFVEALPRNALGKVLKRVLREPYWQGSRRRVSGA